MSHAYSEYCARHLWFCRENDLKQMIRSLHDCKIFRQNARNRWHASHIVCSVSVNISESTILVKSDVVMSIETILWRVIGIGIFSWRWYAWLSWNLSKKNVTQNKWCNSNHHKAAVANIQTYDKFQPCCQWTCSESDVTAASHCSLIYYIFYDVWNKFL